MPPLSDQLEEWFQQPGARTLGGLVELFGEKSFAVLFVVLMAPAALPLPTGGATHVLELITILLALELIAARRTVWLPARWCRLDLAGSGTGRRFARTLVRWIRRCERFSRPRLGVLLRARPSHLLFGLLVLALTLAAFLAPPFSGLDTLPALGVVVLSLALLLEDVVLAVAGLVFGAIGVLLIIVIGGAAYRGISGLF